MPIQVTKIVSGLFFGAALIGCEKSDTAAIGASDSAMLTQDNEQNAQIESEATPQLVDDQTSMTVDSGDDSTDPVESESDQTSQPSEDINGVTDGPNATVGLAVNGYIVVRRTRTYSDSSSQLINTLDYDYSSNQIIVSKTYSNQSTAPVIQSLMTYDELGNWTGLEDLDTSSPFILDREEYLYNDQGYLINSNDYLVNDGSQINAYETNYLSDGRFDSHIGQMRYSLLKAEYDSNTQLVNISNFNSESADSTASYTLTYNFTNDIPSIGEQRIRIASVDRTGSEWFGHSLFYFDDVGNLEVIESYATDGTLRYKDEYLYELSPEPVFNYWLHHLRFVPFGMLYGFPRP